MGLIKAAKDALGGLLADQWREYFYCTSLSSDVLMVKGEKQVTQGRNSNTKGNDNIISNGSIVAVNEGQCMLIVDQGKITEFCAEAGEFIYDSSSEPSLLYGKLGENIKNSFATFGKRFTFWRQYRKGSESLLCQHQRGDEQSLRHGKPDSVPCV